MFRVQTPEEVGRQHRVALLEEASDVTGSHLLELLGCLAGELAKRRIGQLTYYTITGHDRPPRSGRWCAV
jgi:hypothetical protein